MYLKEKCRIGDLLRKRKRIVSLRASDYVKLHRLLLQHGVSDVASAEMKKMHKQHIEGYFDHPAVQYHALWKWKQSVSIHTKLSFLIKKRGQIYFSKIDDAP